MTGRKGLEVSLAVAEAAQLARVEVVAAYPITPQTHIVEHLSELVADGELEASYVTVESEHSAMSACVGASAAGARTFTATSSQGLELMHEILFIASGLRLPIVLVTANRALSAPLNIWNDHSDVMAARDCGWIMLFCTNGQEAVDSVIMAFRIAEDRRVLLPVMINIDGFILTHVVEPVEFPSQELVDAFLPSYVPAYTLHPDKPVTMGAYGLPEIYTECKYAQETALVNSKPVVLEVMEAFGRQFGRSYKPVETYLADDADVLFIAMGAINENIMSAVDELRGEGKKAGLVNLRLYRPFPGEELVAALRGRQRVAVVERAMPAGAINSPLYSEISSLAFRSGIDGLILKNFVIALGGRDAMPSDFRHIFENMQKSKPADMGLRDGLNVDVIGVRA
ncbi:MAG: pyruvate flavodoxin/ferredoxin oxidoreductase domain protein [Deltaproteobacteria bacterium]|jgi:pyruvate ferredoxin oxidoreductase alpha subunit|nr:pyruvate flavodoxin/ferredoxin oxidoreductase domain protein [Deltaproteobacteria bacterium]